MALTIRLLFHTTCILMLTYTILKNKWNSFLGILHNLNVLTIWNQWLLGIFFLFSLIYDIILSMKCKQRTFREFLTHYFNSIVFPMGTFVFLIFWSLCFIDNDFVMVLLTDINNHIIHCLPFVMVLIEKYLVYHPYFHVMVHIVGIIFITASYQSTVLFLRTKTTSWVYLFLDSYKFNSRFLFFFSMWPMITAIYIFGAKINDVMWKSALANFRWS